MGLSFKKVIDTVTLGSDRPIRRLVAYYVILGGVFAALLYFFPIVGQIASGERLEELTQAPQILQDGLKSSQFLSPAAKLPSSVQLAISTTLCLVATLLLMLPTWVYMSARRTKRHNQAVVETLIMLPIVVAAVILIVRNSLALAFSLAGVVSVPCGSTTLRDTRDTVFIFLAIGIGIASGRSGDHGRRGRVSDFNLVALFIWRSDFGRNALVTTANAQQWAEPLKLLAESNGHSNGNGGGQVRSRHPAGPHPQKLTRPPTGSTAPADRRQEEARFNALVSFTTEEPGVVQPAVEEMLDRLTKR
jgi:uncharacterized membrane protein YidH (DUF202 family)